MNFFPTTKVSLNYYDDVDNSKNKKNSLLYSVFNWIDLDKPTLFWKIFKITSFQDCLM